LLSVAHLSPRLRSDDAVDVDAAPRLEALGGLLGLGSEISVGSVARQGDADGQQILLPLADGGSAVTAPQERLVASARRPGESAVADHAIEDGARAGCGNEVAVSEDGAGHTLGHQPGAQASHGLDLRLGGALVAADHQADRVVVGVAVAGALRGLVAVEAATLEDAAL